MRNGICVLGALAAVGLTSNAALAQDFADQGVFIVSGDRLTGFTHSSHNFDPDGPGDTDYDYDYFSLLGQSTVVSPYSMPRISFDYFVIDGLTIGGSLTFTSVSADTDAFNIVGASGTDVTLFTLGPRVGYAIMFADNVGFWPRGGFTIYHESESAGDTDISETGFGLNLDFPFVFVPAEHAAIVVGPGIDLGLVGSGEEDVGGPNFNYDHHIIDFGIYAGLGIWF